MNIFFIIVKIFLVVTIFQVAGTLGCRYDGNGVPEVEMCSFTSDFGVSSVVIKNTYVPTDKPTECSCDITVHNGSTKFTTFFHGPNYDGCGLELKINSFIYFCPDASTSDSFTGITRIYFTKSITDSPAWCMFFQPELPTSFFDIRCYGIDTVPPTLPTTKKTATTTATTKTTTTTPPTTSVAPTTVRTLTAITSAITSSTVSSTTPSTTIPSTTNVTTPPTTSVSSSSSTVKPSTASQTSTQQTGVPTSTASPSSSKVTTTSEGENVPSSSADATSLSTTDAVTPNSAAVEDTDVDSTLVIALVAGGCGLLLIATIIAVVVYINRTKKPKGQAILQPADDPRRRSYIDAFDPRNSAYSTVNPLYSESGEPASTQGIQSFHVEESSSYASVNLHNEMLSKPSKTIPVRIQEERTSFSQNDVRVPNKKPVDVRNRTSVNPDVLHVTVSDTGDMYAVVQKTRTGEQTSRLVSFQDDDNDETKDTPLKGILKNQSQEPFVDNLYAQVDRNRSNMTNQGFKTEHDNIYVKGDRL